MKSTESIVADQNIIAKITFGSNKVQFNCDSLRFIIEHNMRGNTRQITEKRFAIAANLYIALVNRGALQRPESVKQY